MSVNVNSTGNETTVEIGDLTLYYSYKTVVAFHTPETGFKVSRNVWSTTTGKHLTHIDGGSKEAKEARLPREEFNAALKGILHTHKIAD